MTRVYTVAILSFLLLSCASNQPQELKQLPNWYVLPTVNNSQNLYGVGEGYTMAEASKSALNNLAGKLMTSISSESSMLLESNRYGVNEQSRQKINQVIEMITFANYQISQSASYNGKIYAEIAVDRDVFIKDRKQKLEDLNKQMSNLADGLSGKTILERRNILQKINKLAIEASRINAVLAGILADGIDFKSNANLYNSYQNSYQTLLDKIEFFIDNKNAPKSVVNVLTSALNQEKIKVVKTKNLANPNLVVVEVKSEMAEQKIYGSNIAKLTLNFVLLSNQNKIINSNDVQVSGSSVIDKNEAVNSAISSLADKINQEGILEILGTKN